MQCPNCQAINPDEAKFCENCGTALELACPNCGKPVPAAAKFCRNCGYRMAPVDPANPVASASSTSAAPPAAASPAPRTSVPSAAAAQSMPDAYRVRLETARAERTMQGERRIVTVLFCDVKGSTAMAEQLDPEDWAEIMNRAFQHLIQPVYRYEGTVARLMGDAILAFFGAPIAHEDDPERAVLAGLGIVEDIRAFRDQLRRERGLDFNVRVGINTGLVVVGEVGSDLRVEYTAMGDAVNLAARMEQTAQPGTVQIAENTYRTVAPLFDCEPLGGIEVKGKAEPVLAYRVLRPKTSPGRMRGIAGLDSPLVGRAAEFGAIQRAIRALRQGQGSIIALMGEAGLGKSRLLAEARQWALSADASSQPASSNQLQWSEGRSVSYDTATPYAPFATS
jgi:class 3 adenylate cyclase